MATSLRDIQNGYLESPMHWFRRARESRKSAKTIGWVTSFAVWMIFGLTTPISVYAQVVGGTLSGTVTDPSGAVVPNSQMTIKNVGTGVTRKVAADASGFYTAPNLLPGTYDITVTAPGFKTEVRPGGTLTVGAEQSLNITMEVGQVAETVTVTGAAPTVELASSTTGSVIDSTTVVELPLNGRDWTLLAALVSGVNTVEVQTTTGFSSARAARGFGNQVTVSGSKPQLNNYRLDGISITDYSGGSPGSVVEGITMGVDAIGEFSVLTSNSAAEYGRTAGGVINAVTRSGANQFHGDAYWFLRDEGLDSRGFFDGPKLPPFHRNQFGGSLGGPIQKDKTFFFVNYEGFRQVLGNTNVDLVPSPNARMGIIAGGGAPVSSCPAGTTLFVPGQSNLCVNNLVIPYLPLFPLPNKGLVGNGNTGHFNVVSSQNARENFVTNRIDHTFSEKDSLAGTWLLDKAYLAQPDTFDELLFGNTDIRILATVEETHAFSPSLVNTFRIGYSRIHPIQNQFLSAIAPNGPLAVDPSLGVGPGLSAPALTVSGLQKYLGRGGSPLNSQPWNSYQLYDDAFLTKGTHSLKFGFAGEDMQHNPHVVGFQSGFFGFGGLTNFLSNKPASLVGPGGLYTSKLRQRLFGGYLQDDWRFRPNLTLNLGVRYEAVTVVTEKFNHLTNLRNITDPAPTIGAPLIMNPNLHNFEPRIGFAWDPFRNGKTSVRGAFGMFDVLPLTAEFFTGQQAGFPFTKSLAVANLPPGSFPTILGTLLTGGAASAFRYKSYQFDPARNYVMIWNLNIQRALTPSTALTIGYVGNHGVHMLETMNDVNLVLPVMSTSSGLLWPTPVGSGATINHFLSGQIAPVSWTGSSLYDALDVTLSKKFSHGFQAQGSYSWGKNIDTGSGTTVADPYQNSIGSPFYFCGRRCVRGLSDFNVAQNLTVNYIWDLPTPTQWGSAVSYILGGWEVGGILTAHTGLPITPMIGGDPLGLNSSDTYSLPDRLRGPGCQGNPVNPGSVNNYIKLQCFALPVSTPAIAALCQPFGIQDGEPPLPGTCANLLGNAGRNSIVGPGLLGLDFALFKNNHIKENLNMQFRAEFFNIINHSNFVTPADNNTLFNQDGSPTGGAGSFDTLAGTAREIQFGLKLIW
jgi:outer membrane receptor protein involved in Fe transport